MTDIDSKLRPHVSDAEADDRRLMRDQDIHAAVCSRRDKAAVALQYGVTLDEVDAAVRSVDATLRALSAAARPAAAPGPRTKPPSGWPPPRIRNCLEREFGIPRDMMGDAALVAETVTRTELMGMHLMGESAARTVAEFLASHGLRLKD